MSEAPLESLSAQLEGEDQSSPPLHLWNPDLSGDIDIRIDRQGRWLHEGSEIKRKPLVKLFASILRREDDGDYYLLTPVEKWRIKVDCLPLIVVEAEFENEGNTAMQQIHVRTNTDAVFSLGAEHPLEIVTLAGGEKLPAVNIRNGLSALISRPVYYELAEHCKGKGGKYGLYSEGLYFPLEG